MSIINDTSLKFATLLLRHRLIRPNHIDINVIEPNSSNKQLSNLDGRFIGYFNIRPNREPCFILFGRSIPFKDIDHLFVFYMRTNYKSVQASEKSLFNTTMPGLNANPPTIATSAINIISKAPKTCDLSILIQTLEFTIAPALFNDLVASQIVLAHKGSSLVCFNANIPFPKCKLEVVKEANHDIWDLIDLMDLKVYILTRLPDNISEIFDILIIKYQNHFVYVLHYKPIKTLMILLPHNSLFKTRTDAESFVNTLEKLILPYKVRYIGATRFYGTANTCCDDRIVLKACLLALKAESNPLVTIKLNDIEAIMPDSRIISMTEALKKSNEPNKPDDKLNDDELSDLTSCHDTLTHTYDVTEPVIITDVRFDGTDGEEETLSIINTAISSQSTIIMSNNQIENELSLYKMKPFVRNMLDNNIPPCSEVKPKNDISAMVLNSTEFYIDALRDILELWNPYGMTKLLSLMNLKFSNGKVSLNIDTHSRFIVIPFIDGQLKMIIIVDSFTREFVYINPDNNETHDLARFTRLDEVIRNNCTELKDYQSRPLMITSNFHKRFPLVHLLMSVFHIGKLFKYTVTLPVKVIYGEREFRSYCHLICLQLQLANHEYNLINGLIKANGHMKPNAFRSISSPIQYERSIVPFDQCAYCKRRGFSNLSRHISMEHGNQASYARAHRE